MGRFVEAADRDQSSFLPACLEDYVDANNPVRIIDAFVDKLELAELGFGRAAGLDRQTRLRARHDAQALCLWLPASAYVEPEA